MSTDTYQLQIIDEADEIRYTETEDGIGLPKDDTTIDCIMKGTMFRQIDRMYIAGEIKSEEEYKKEYKKIANARIIHNINEEDGKPYVIHAKHKGKD